MRHPEKRNPVVCGDRASQKSVHLCGLNKTENSPSYLDLQALNLSRRFGLSRPVASVVADLHYNAGGRA